MVFPKPSNMTRNVFIIASPLSPAQTPFYNGVKRDSDNFYNYFRSPMGGAFHPNEIHVLENPDWSSLVVKMLLNRADYSIVVFSGHGYAGVPSYLTKLQISENKTVSVLDIAKVNPASKQLFIVDACRNFFSEDADVFMRDPVLGLDFPSDLDAIAARTAFEKSVRKAKNGLQIIYSCSQNEFSKRSENGGYFSKSLLESVKDWAVNCAVGNVLLGVGAHKMATNYLRGFTNKQTPQIEFNSGANFPFATRKPIRQISKRRDKI
jgi:hypothetical protein